MRILGNFIENMSEYPIEFHPKNFPTDNAPTIKIKESLDIFFHIQYTFRGAHNHNIHFSKLKSARVYAVCMCVHTVISLIRNRLFIQENSN